MSESFPALKVLGHEMRAYEPYLEASFTSRILQKENPAVLWISRIINATLPYELI